MAADTSAGWGAEVRQAGKFRKIVRLSDGSLAGLSGDLSTCWKFIDWLESTKALVGQISRPELKDSSVLVVAPKGNIHQYD
jgi:hypothetical protein